MSLRTVPVWLLAFCSPTIYVLLFMLAIRTSVARHLPVEFYITFFVVIFFGALLFCVSSLWAASMTLTRKIGLTVFTSLGLLLQVGIIVFILWAILITVTAYPQ